MKPASVLRRRSLWAAAGACAGAAVAALSWAPAAWLAEGVAGATDGRLVLADARGTVWTGSATVVLTGGAGSSAASALPGRLSWKLRPRPGGLELRARQDCCLSGEQRVRLGVGLDGYRVRLLPPRNVPDAAPIAVGQVPATVLGGLGAPWNTLDLGGLLRVTVQGLQLGVTQGRLSIAGRAELRVEGLSSKLSSLPVLGDYRLVVDAPATGAGTATLTLDTLRGPLQLDGQGQLGGASPLRFRGLARAQPGSESSLNNLLNVIGRRTGPVSNLSIG